MTFEGQGSPFLKWSVRVILDHLSPHSVKYLRRLLVQLLISDKTLSSSM